MSPDPDADIRRGNLILAGHADTANDLAEVTQVESVVRLHGGGLQVLLDLLIDLHRPCHELGVHGRDLGGEVVGTEVPLQDRLEDTVHGVLIEDGKGDHIEVALETRGDETLTTTWGAHSCDYHGVNDVSERMLVLLPIIPSPLINHLSQYLNGRLCAIILFLGHVKIVYEYDAFHPELWPEVILPPLVDLQIYYVLNLKSCC